MKKSQSGGRVPFQRAVGEKGGVHHRTLQLLTGGEVRMGGTFNKKHPFPT